MRILLAILGLVLLGVVSAQENQPVRVDGFASFVGGQLIGDEAFHLSDYDEDLRFDLDSIFAVQVKGDMGEDLSATAQFIGAGAEDYEAELEWAFLSYRFSPAWRVNMGRTRLPMFMYSDTLDVGYSYHWITPPELVYDLPFDNIEGVDFEHLGSLGRWGSRWNFLAGRTKEPFFTGGEDSTVELRNMLGTTWTLSRDWLSLRLTYYQADVDIPIQSVYDDDNPSNPETIAGALELAAAGVGLPAGFFDDTVQGMRIHDDRGQFYGIGLLIERGNYLFAAEYTNVDVKDSLSPDQDNYYVSAGRRFNDWLIHLTFAGEDEDPKTEHIDSVKANLPSGVDPDIDATIAAVETAVNLQDFNSDIWTLGARYDFHPAAAFKLEFKYQDDEVRDKTARLVLFGVDAVF